MIGVLLFLGGMAAGSLGTLILLAVAIDDRIQRRERG